MEVPTFWDEWQTRRRTRHRRITAREEKRSIVVDSSALTTQVTVRHVLRGEGILTSWRRGKNAAARRFAVVQWHILWIIYNQASNWNTLRVAHRDECFLIFERI